MKMMILAEKPSLEKFVRSAIESDTSNEIYVSHIGGHIFTKDEISIANSVTEDYLSSCNRYILKDGTAGYIFGEDTIAANVMKVGDMIKENGITVVINACDADKNGDALFEFALKLLGNDNLTVYRLPILDYTENHIREKYNELIKQIVNQ